MPLRPACPGTEIARAPPLTTRARSSRSRVPRGKRSSRPTSSGAQGSRRSGGGLAPARRRAVALPASRVLSLGSALRGAALALLLCRAARPRRRAPARRRDAWRLRAIASAPEYGAGLVLRVRPTPLAPPRRRRHRRSLAKQARRRPSASSTSLRTSSCAPSLAATPPTSLASRPSRCSSTPRLRWRASACGRKSAASSCRRSQRARAAPCGGCAIRRCCASTTRRRGRLQAGVTASSLTVRGGSGRAARRLTVSGSSTRDCLGTARV